MQSMVWLGLGYNVPVNPSKNRVYVWRKLRELGASYFKHGVAILPNNAQNLSQFSALAAKIRQMGGEANLIELRFLDQDDEAEIIERFCKQSENEYRALLHDCAALMTGIQENLFPASERVERLRKMVKRYAKVKSRDYFHSRSRSDLAQSLGELASDMAHITDEIGRQLRNILDL